MRCSASVVLCSIFFAIVMMALPATSGAQIGIGISVNFGPPALPVYEQPPCPSPGYLWTPGYWAYGPDGYYWVPGTWVMAPQPGFLWTPGWWGWGGSAFLFHVGYWGPHIGFYGGINYGFGYGGFGYVGGRWVGNAFAYNRAVNNVNANVFRHVYDEPVVNQGGFSRVSYNGGPGGTSNVPTAQERLAAPSRLPSVPQRMHLQPGPNPAPSIPSSTAQTALVPKPLLSHPQAASAPRQITASAVTQPRAAVNAAIRPASTPPSTPRLRAAPAIKSTPIK